MNKPVLLFILLAAPLNLVFAQDDICRGTALDVPASTPTTPRFEFTADSETVIDRQTGLKWARCQWGYEWSVASATCKQVNDGELTWKQALTIVKDDPVYLGEQGWRLPNIKELASLVEYKCVNPAINNLVFPGTEAGLFWSNTHVAADGTVRVVHFSGGELLTYPGSSSAFAYLRPVKDAD